MAELIFFKGKAGELSGANQPAKGCPKGGVATTAIELCEQSE
jgi:hypothetical protein